MEDVAALSKKSDEYLFNKYDLDGYSSGAQREYEKIGDKISLNEYKAQKELLAIMNIFSKEYSNSEESYGEYVEWYVPTQNFFDEIIQEIDFIEYDINYRIEEYFNEKDGESGGKHKETE